MQLLLSLPVPSLNVFAVVHLSSLKIPECCWYVVSQLPVEAARCGEFIIQNLKPHTEYTMQVALCSTTTVCDYTTPAISVYTLPGLYFCRSCNNTVTEFMVVFISLKTGMTIKCLDCFDTCEYSSLTTNCLIYVKCVTAVNRDILYKSAMLNIWRSWELN